MWSIRDILQLRSDESVNVVVDNARSPIRAASLIEMQQRTKKRSKARWMSIPPPPVVFRDDTLFPILSARNSPVEFSSIHSGCLSSSVPPGYPRNADSPPPLMEYRHCDNHNKPSQFSSPPPATGVGCNNSSVSLLPPPPPESTLVPPVRKKSPIAHRPKIIAVPTTSTQLQTSKQLVSPEVSLVAMKIPVRLASPCDFRQRKKLGSRFNSTTTAAEHSFSPSSVVNHPFVMMETNTNKSPEKGLD